MTSRKHAAARWTALAALLLFWPVVGCERNVTEEPTPVTPADGGATSAPTFALPEVDVSSLSPKLQEMVAKWRKDIDSGVTAPNLFGSLGAVYLVNGFPEPAVLCFRRATEVEPAGMHWWYYLGLAHERTGAQQHAAEAYQRALTLKPDYAPLFVRIANLLRDTDRKQAADLCRRALELNPRDSKAKLVLGLCAEADERLDDAEARFREALAIFPEDGEAHAALARVLAATNREQEAEAHREAAKKGKVAPISDPLFSILLRNAYNTDALVQGALMMADQGSFEEAEKMLAALREVDEQGIATAQATAAVRLRQGRLADAAAELRRVLEIRPDSINDQSNLANILALQGQAAEAEELFKKALAVEPGHTVTLLRYANMLANTNRRDEAEKLLADGVAKQPEDARLRLDLGLLLYERGAADEAREQLQVCVKLEPSIAQAHYTLGVIASQADDAEAAKAAWEETIKCNPKWTLAYAALAAQANTNKDYAAAEKYVREGMTQVPDNANLRNGLAWLLATSPNDSQRNGAEAVELAETVCQRVPQPEHGFLDTLAAAYAEVGRFEDAASKEQEAIDLAEAAGLAESVEAYRARLELYKQNQPYREGS